MSTIYSALAPIQGTTRHSRVNGLAVSLKRSWRAYITRRIEQRAIVQLQSMSDLEH